jgi:hypothetical protein
MKQAYPMVFQARQPVMRSESFVVDVRRPQRGPRWAVVACCCGLLALTGFVGCARQSGPAVEYVEGSVLVDGEPVADATVGFSPAGGAGLAAFGQTDAKGIYRLTTVQGGKKLGGAPVGDYTVTVKKYRNRFAELGPPPTPEQDPKGYAAFKAEYDRLETLPLESLIPAGYAEMATTPLRATVKPGRNVGPAFTFDLTTDFKPTQPGK